MYVETVKYFDCNRYVQLSRCSNGKALDYYARGPGSIPISGKGFVGCFCFAGVVLFTCWSNTHYR